MAARDAGEQREARRSEDDPGEDDESCRPGDGARLPGWRKARDLRKLDAVPADRRRAEQRAYGEHRRRGPGGLECRGEVAAGARRETDATQQDLRRDKTGRDPTPDDAPDDPPPIDPAQ